MNEDGILTKVLNMKLEVKISNQGQHQDENNRCHTEDKQNMRRSWDARCFRREMEGVCYMIYTMCKMSKKENIILLCSQL